ncbi:MAG TPA: VOC family protein [Pyrinomonadaceae bacterium]|nr:VOC family protein [Pyrinomonadaceae bacterium]
MAERSIIDQLDDAVTALLAQREPVVSEPPGELAELVAIARELRGLPSAQFRAALKEQLGGKENMSTAAKQVEQSPQPESKPKSKSFKREGFHTVTPYIIAQPAVELVDFVKQAFGALESFRTTGSAGGLHCEVKIGDSVVMIGGGPTFDPRPVAIHLYVSDVDDVYARALEAGATSLAAPSDQEYGERIAAVKDIGGNEWYIAKRFDQTPIPNLQTVTVYFHPMGAAKFISFLERAFGAEVVERHQSEQGFVYHAKVRLGDSIVEMGEAHDQWQPMQSAIYMYVEDVDALYRQALSAGATSALEPTNQPYGGRSAWVNDEFGNVWYLSSRQG